jgi:hypothetical protein
MPTFAKGDKRLVRVMQDRPTAFTPPTQPFAFEKMHVIAWCDDPCVMVCFGIQFWDVGISGGGKLLNCAPVPENNKVIIIKAYAIIWKVIAFG